MSVSHSDLHFRSPLRDTDMRLDRQFSVGLNEGDKIDLEGCLTGGQMTGHN